ARGLSEARYTVELAVDGPAGLEKASGGPFDLGGLGLRLPGLNGLELLRTPRARGGGTPGLGRTAPDRGGGQGEARRIGADDYVTRPLARAELLARVEALGRRPKALPPPVLQIADLKIDTGSRVVTRGGRTIDLTPKEYDVLLYLARHAGRVMSRTLI